MRREERERRREEEREEGEKIKRRKEKRRKEKREEEKRREEKRREEKRRERKRREERREEREIEKRREEKRREKRRREEKREENKEEEEQREEKKKRREKREEKKVWRPRGLALALPVSLSAQLRPLLVPFAVLFVARASWQLNSLSRDRSRAWPSRAAHQSLPLTCASPVSLARPRTASQCRCSRCRPAGRRRWSWSARSRQAPPSPAQSRQALHVARDLNALAVSRTPRGLRLWRRWRIMRTLCRMWAFLVLLALDVARTLLGVLSFNSRIRLWRLSGQDAGKPNKSYYDP